MPKIVRYGHGKAIKSEKFDRLSHEDRQKIVNKVRNAGRNAATQALGSVDLNNGSSVTVSTIRPVKTTNLSTNYYLYGQ